MAVRGKIKTQGMVELPNKSLIKRTIVASIIQTERSYSLLGGNGRQIHFTELTGEKGKTPEDVELISTEIYEADKNDPMLSLGAGCYVRCSAIEAIENHGGSDFSGLIIRGVKDIIIGYLSIADYGKRIQVAEMLGDSIKSYENGNFSQAEFTSLKAEIHE
ncbi:MAG: hypothetical protein V7771_16815 [Shewanella psychromarinicola]|uniref:hypothetical protein n=1 Tax=Shewanella psychromarinicola TaxID=2487742 RepID=UPI00300189D3